MLKLQVIRGTAALPHDIEHQFFIAHGREMNREEREFFGLPLTKKTNGKKRLQSASCKPQLKAA